MSDPDSENRAAGDEEDEEEKKQDNGNGYRWSSNQRMSPISQNIVSSEHGLSTTFCMMKN